MNNINWNVSGVNHFPILSSDGLLQKLSPAIYEVNYTNELGFHLIRKHDNYPLPSDSYNFNNTEVKSDLAALFLNRFKSKGEKHANSKVRTLTSVDDAKEQLKLDTAAAITPVWRIDQAIQETFDTLNGGQLDITKIGAVIKWVSTDILKEELITINESGLTYKELSGPVSKLVKERFFELYNS